jgi:predicted nucleic acid-binding protein
MSKKYYFDSSIWRDYFENRKDKFRPLGEWAFELIKQIIKEKGIILYSELVIDELRKDWSQEAVNSCFGAFRSEELLVKAEITPEQYKEAVRLAREKKVPRGDALHAILARDNDAIMVARDKHFLELDDVANHKKPEELI